MVNAAARLCAILAAAFVAAGVASPYAYVPAYGRVRTEPVRGAYGEVKPRARVVQVVAMLALVRALYGRVRRRSMPARPYVRQAGTGSACHPSMRQVRVPGPVPGLYPGRTSAGQPAQRRYAVVAVGAAWPLPEHPPGYARTRPGARRVRRYGRPVSRHRPKWMKGERGRELRRALAARDGARCLYCGQADDPAAFTLDHYVPFSWARRHGWRRVHEPRNLVLACRACNEQKGNRLPWPLVWLLLAVAEREPVGMPAAA